MHLSLWDFHKNVSVTPSTLSAFASAPIRVFVSVRVFCSDVYAALAEVRRDLAQAWGVTSGI
jgi:hypothetical protein